MNSTAVVGNEAAFAETIQEEAHARARCADHFSKGLLTDPGNYTEESWTLACSSEVKQKASKAFFAGIENVIGQISLHAEIARSELSDELVSHRGRTFEKREKRALFQPNDLAAMKRNRGHHANRLAGETTFPEEGVFAQNVDDSLFAIPRDNTELYFAAFYIKDCVGRLALQKHGFIWGVVMLGPSDSETCQELVCVEERGVRRWFSNSP